MPPGRRRHSAPASGITARLPPPSAAKPRVTRPRPRWKNWSRTRVEACVAGATSSTPESEFGEGDSEEEQEENYPPSVGEASTMDYCGEVDPVDYGEGEEEEEDYPPSVGSSADDHGEGEGDYPSSLYSAPTIDYGEGEEDYPLSVCSGVSEYTDSEPYTEDEGSPVASERSVRTVKGRTSPAVSASSDPYEGSAMDCSRGGSSAAPMSWSLGSEEEEEMEAEEEGHTARSSHPQLMTSFVPTKTDASVFTTLHKDMTLHLHRSLLQSV
ncbi:uncharacterized protein LOC143481768 [Brachyhypopomus gauderio]|uniref:uncharacterized protein LOC143481768 n=1 Tax=Brachyhypopomus gauderio TaxID=698409 RepID=UPI0040423966